MVRAYSTKKYLTLVRRPQAGLLNSVAELYESEYPVEFLMYRG